MKKIKFIDLFAGLGGFRVVLEKNAKKQNIKTECVLVSEIDDDRYFITFDEYGIIKCSQKIINSIQYYGFDPEKLNVPIININSENLPYLIKHNKIFEEKERQRV